MTNEEYIVKTQGHIDQVWQYVSILVALLASQVGKHDASKLVDPEKTLFLENYSTLGQVVYGSPEYEEQMKAIKPATDHHYKHSRHHPEHHKNGINDMNLIDICEMLCDWVASSKRSKDGDPYRSVEVSAKRFNMSPQLESILRNTVSLLVNVSKEGTQNND